MKRLWAAIAIIVVIAGLLLLSRSRKPLAENPAIPNGTVLENGSNSPATQDSRQTAAAPAPALGGAPASNELAMRAASPDSPSIPSAETNELTALAPLTVLDKARVMIHNYRDALGENPVGTNPEITAALKGKNPRQINFFQDSGLRVNEKGELVDGYGTPFFFHQISGQEMEIRSAGRDRVMWTADDLVTK